MSIETGLVPAIPLPRREVRSVATPSRLFGFIWRVSAHDQLWLAVLSVLVFAAGVLPLELQRRIVNNAFVGGSVKTIVGLAGAYVGLALTAGLLKLGLNIYRSYVSENAVRWLRTALLDDLCCASPVNRPKETEGVAVSLVLDEAEPIGSFVGVCLSEPLLQGGILVGVFGYMVFLEPLMAVVAFAVFCPQLFFVPRMQQAINGRVASRIGLLRQISIGIIGQPDSSAAVRSPQATRIQEVFALNMGIFKLKFSMNFLMNLMHHLGVAAILAVGGYFVITGRTEIGTVVAFVSGLGQINDPWGDLVNWFRDLKVTETKYDLISRAVGAPRAACQ